MKRLSYLPIRLFAALAVLSVGCLPSYDYTSPVTCTNPTVTTTQAGSTSGFADGNLTTAQFNTPTAVGFDLSGNLIVIDQLNHRIRRISGAGTVSTLAGTGVAGFADGPGTTTAQFNNPSSFAVEISGNIIVADKGNHRIRRITPSGIVSTIAGSTQGFADGNGTAAQFDGPTDVTIDAAGNLYVTDMNNHRIRRISTSGDVSTLAGSATPGNVDGTGAAAQFNQPAGIIRDITGTLYVVDRGNHRIRRVTQAGVVTTIVGSTQGSADGAALTAQFNSPFGITLDGLGNLFISDQGNHRIRKISTTGAVTTLAGSTSGLTEGTGTAAQFNQPAALTVSADGSLLFVADQGNHRIRRLVCTQ